MPRTRSRVPLQKRPAAKGLVTRQHARAATAEPQVAPAPQSILGLQRLAGNRAVQAQVVASSGPKPAQKPLPLQRLWSKAEFKKQTDAGFLSGRGKTMVQIDNLLAEFDGFKAQGKHLLPGREQDRSINILHEIIEDVSVWMQTHEGDKSRSKKRIPGLTKLAFDAGKELRELEGIREKGREFMGQKQEPIARTENLFKTQMEGSVSSILSKLGPVFSAVAPSSGDTGELEVQIKVPVDPSGAGYVGMRVKASVERMKQKAMKMRFELAVTGGAKIGNVADVGGELGIYLESQGATPEKALELISYGIYRRFRESRVIPNEVANFIWGGSATGVGWNRSEKWAGKVEKENFKDSSSFATSDSDEGGAYVETGALAGAKAKGGVGGVAELEGSAQFTTGQHYDHSSVKGLKGKRGMAVGESAPAPTARFQTHHLGESVHHLDFGFSAKGGPFSGGLKVGIDWSTQQRNAGLAKLQSLRVGFEAAATLPMSELVAGGLIGAIAPLSASVIKGIRAAATGASTDKRSDSQDTGEIIGATENGVTAISQMSSIPKTAFVPKFEVGQPPPAFAAPVDLKLSLSGTYDFLEKKFIFELKVEYIKGIDINVGVFEMKVRKGQRIVRVLYDGGWTVD